jgi:membrane associated rhomboid family serine protease
MVLATLEINGQSRSFPPVTESTLASVEASRAVHADAVRLKRGELQLALICCAVLLAGVMAARGHVELLFQLMVPAALAILWAGRLTFDLIGLRRADPDRLLGLEHTHEAERAGERREYIARAAGLRPGLTLGLIATVALVTAVQFLVPGVGASVALAGLVKPAVRAGEWWRLLSSSYLHGSALHLCSNLSALVVLGEMVEIYDRRARLPLVYLAAVIGGGLASTWLIAAPAVGASGGIIGLAGYLLVVGLRQPPGATRLLRERIVSILASTALTGAIGFFFIDNAAHVGGALTGALVGLLTVPRGGERNESIDRHLDRLGWLAAAVLITGAAFTVVRLFG